MKKLFTFYLAVAASITSLWADDIQFTNLPYTYYSAGDSVRVQATTSLPDMPMPTNYEYGFEYEYKNADGNSGGGGVEPCAIVNGHMETVLRIKPSDSFQCYRYRSYYVTDSWNGERAAGEWVLISEWSQTEWPADPINPMDGVNVDSLIAAIDLHTLAPVEITEEYAIVVATANIPNIKEGINIRCGFEKEFGTGLTYINGWRTFQDGLMQDTLRYDGAYSSFSYRAFIEIDYVPRIEGEWIEIPEWVNIMHGNCGDSLQWRFNSTDSVLTISGTGNMTDFAYGALWNNSPWYNVFQQDIKTIVISEGVTSIGNSAFKNCNNLESVIIANSVTKIGNSAFQGCDKLTSIVIPNNVTYVGTWAFGGCSSLESLEILGSVLEIDTYAFGNCSSLDTITFNPELRTIKGYAFYNCTHLKSVVIPNSVDTIEGGAFYGCSSLKTIVLPTNIEKLGGGVFDRCTALEYIQLPQTGLTVIDGLFNGCSSLKSITIPASVQRIGSYAFGGCTSLDSVYIPSGIIEINNRAFNGCSALKSLIVDSDNTIYDSRENCNAIIETGTNKLHICCPVSVIPNSVIAIGDFVFANRIDLDSITIPQGVTALGEYVFQSCTSLKSVIIPSSVLQIGKGAFAGCSALTNIQLPIGLASVEDYTFNNCSALVSIVIPNGVKSLGDYAFQYCYALQNVSLPEGLQSIGKYAFYACGRNFTSINIPSSVTFIGATAFVRTGLYENDNNWDGYLLYLNHCLVGSKHTISGEVRIKEGTKVIASQTFRTYDMSSIIMPKTITHIGGGAFAWCDMLTSITCEAATPPITVNSIMGSQFDDVFYNVGKSIPVYVPAGAEELYREANNWNEFTNIRAIGQAQTADVVDIQAEPTDNSVVIEWPVVANAVVYTIEIRKNGVLICTLSFNANGQLTSVQFAAPARSRANSPQRAEESATGWTYTIAGLEASTAYTYTVTAKDSSNEEVYNNTIAFTTQPQNTPTDFEQAETLDTPNKIIYNGQLHILHGDKTYTITGAEVK